MLIVLHQYATYVHKYSIHCGRSQTYAKEMENSHSLAFRIRTRETASGYEIAIYASLYVVYPLGNNNQNRHGCEYA